MESLYLVTADALLVIHTLFVAFVVLGACLIASTGLRRPKPLPQFRNRRLQVRPVLRVDGAVRIDLALDSVHGNSITGAGVDVAIDQFMSNLTAEFGER